MKKLLLVLGFTCGYGGTVAIQSKTWIDLIAFSILLAYGLFLYFRTIRRKGLIYEKGKLHCPHCNQPVGLVVKFNNAATSTPVS